MGDSIGRWEGDTLVVDTTNFNDGGGFYGDAGGNFGWDRNLHLIERFSLLDADTLLYRFEIDDPTAFTQPWKGELTMARSPGPIYEYACHEGNYSLANMLSGIPRQRNGTRAGPAPRSQIRRTRSAAGMERGHRQSQDLAGPHLARGGNRPRRRCVALPSWRRSGRVCTGYGAGGRCWPAMPRP